MKIAILTYGSRGDVQPFLPLSLGLMARGHKVILAAPSRFKSLVEGYAIPFYPLAGEPEDLSRRFNDAGYNFIQQLLEMMSHAVEIGADVLRQTGEVCKDADLIIHTFAHTVGAHTLAREMDIPDIHVQTFPMFTPTGDYPNVTMPDFGNRFWNLLTHKLSMQISWLSAGMGFELVRRRAGLSRRKLFFPFRSDSLRLPTPILCAWSPSLLSPSGDWSPNVHVTGYYFFPPDRFYLPPPELEEFLNSGVRPVCVSFGSMVNRDSQRIDEIIREALKQTNSRGVVLSGWGGINQHSSRDLLYLESAPHDWLLPKCKMVIHHGGAGTTSAGLRTGIPSIVVPFTANQPFWGRRIHAVGAGPQPILVKNLSVERLVKAIVEAESSSIRGCAETMGQRVREEDGVAKAVLTIESHVMAFYSNFHQ